MVLVGARRLSTVLGCGVLAACGGASTGPGVTATRPPASAPRPAGAGHVKPAAVATGNGTPTQTGRSVRTAARAGSGGGGFVLRPVADARGCTPPHLVPDRRAPAAIATMLGLLRLPRTSIDGLPVSNRTDHRASDDTGWLPASTLDYRGLRRRRNSNHGIYVVPSATVLELSGERLGAPCPSLLKAPVAPGACLVVGPPGGPFAVRCWTVPEIVRGRALTLVVRGNSRMLAGLAPSGTTLVLRSDTGRRLRIRSIDGVLYLPTSLPPDGHLRSQVAG